jgi:hypothetical protein
VGQDEHVAAGVELRPAGTPEDLVGRAGLHHLLVARRALEDAGQDDRAGGQVDARRQRLGADGHREELPLEQLLDNAAILGQHARMVDAHAAEQQLLELRAGPFRPVVAAQLGGKLGLLAGGQHPAALELLGHAPAGLAVEAEDQGGRGPRIFVAPGHLFDVLAQEPVGHPMERQRHLPLVALHPLDAAVVRPAKPLDELVRVAHRGREQKQPNVPGQEAEGELPDDAPLAVVEAVELVHHHRAGAAEVERLAVQQAVEEDFGHNHQHPGPGVLAAVARDQAHVFRREAPADGVGLHLAELLLGQGDQRRGVVGRRAGGQGLEHGRFGDERLAHARRRADQHPLLRGKPGQQGLLLEGVRIVRQLGEVAVGDLVARGRPRSRLGLGHGGLIECLCAGASAAGTTRRATGGPGVPIIVAAFGPASRA